MTAKPVYLLPGGPASGGGELAGDCRAALRACGTPKPAVAYVGTASDDDPDFFRFMEKPLLAAGAGCVRLAPLAGAGADPGLARERLAEADAVFLSGGEVDAGMAWLRRAGVEALLVDLHRAGTLFFGLSAGCIMMGRHWVRWDDPGDDATARLFPCLALVPFTFDAHGEDGDWEELKCAVRLLGPGARGYGLATGGFYRADGEGNLTRFRREPAVFRNVRGVVTPERAEE